MKHVLLIGDSIRMGYENYVKDAFEGVAEVKAPEGNCRYALQVLRYAHEWRKLFSCTPEEVDVIHWNAGLWDVLRMYGDEPLTPVEFYGNLIKRIDVRLRLLFPNAKIIFATSTRVIEERYPKNFMRKNSVIEEYNKAAIEVMKKYGYYVNDLYELTKSLDLDHYSDMTHLYTEKGRVALLRQVLDSICDVLPIENDFDCEAIVKEVGGLSAPLGL